MAHGGCGKRRVAERRPVSRRTKGLGLEKKHKPVLFKNQIRSIERMLRKDLPLDARKAQEQKLEQLRKEQGTQLRFSVERRIFLRDRRIKFFERRKIERRIRRLERQQRASSNHVSGEIFGQLTTLREDLEYVKFFPKTEKYVSLFTRDDDIDAVDNRNRLRELIKSNLIAATASGKDLEETASEDDWFLDLSDDFFSCGSSSDEADADDEWTDRSTREQTSSASGKAASSMSSDEKNQRNRSARVLMPPPRLPANHRSGHFQTRFAGSSSANTSTEKIEQSASSNTSNSSNFLPREWRSSTALSGQGSNLSSNSDAHGPPRKRRLKKKQV